VLLQLKAAVDLPWSVQVGQLSLLAACVCELAPSDWLRQRQGVGFRGRWMQALLRASTEPPPGHARNSAPWESLWCAAWLACRYRRRCGLPGAKRRTIGALPVEFERRTALMWTRAGNTVVRRIGIPATACTATGRTFAPTRSSRSPPKSHWKTAGADVALAEAQRGTAANRARTARIRELEDAPNAQIQIEDCDA
jgi:hypothetical protein